MAPVDSLLQVIAHKDVQLAALSARLDSLVAAARDTTALFDKLTQGHALRVPVEVVKMPTDWGQLLIPPLAALLAAWLGAWYGGKTVRESSMATLRDEWRMEREHALERLRMRAKSNLRRVQLLSAKVAGHAPENPLDPEVGEELEVVWNLYYRVAEPIFTLGSEGLSERLDAFFVKTHTVAEIVKALEAQAREVTTVGHETEKYRDTYKAREQLPGRRSATITKIIALGEEAETLLKEIEAL